MKEFKGVLFSSFINIIQPFKKVYLLQIFNTLKVYRRLRCIFVKCKTYLQQNQTDLAILSLFLQIVYETFYFHFRNQDTIVYN